jgi:signal transduction histidine kinase
MVGYILSGVLLLVLAAVLVRRASDMRRLRKLSDGMEDYLTGNGGKLQLSLKEDTVARVENAAEEMQNRIETAEERFRLEARRTSSLTADISHQLKTPLASLRLFCEMDGSAHCEQQISQIERMETLISSLLRLEKLCADGYEFSFGEENIRTMVDRVWSQLQPLWPDRQAVVEGEAMIRCDRKWLEEAFRNLIRNACEHTESGGKILIRMEQTDRTFYCTVEDDGGGVRPEDLPHLFERFYRAEGEKSKGAGLGLAIVKEIIVRHHGHITAENTGKGLRFIISMPVLDMARS